MNDHIQHLATILNVLEEHQLYANFKKCSFGQQEMAYLGHIVSSKGIAVDLDKNQTMVDWSSPRNLKELRGFLGLTGYYRRFINKYAHIATPLMHQLCKDCFAWDEEAEIAFQQLKQALLNAPVLCILNFSLPFVVEADASGHGLGAVLSQEKHPIAFFF